MENLLIIIIITMIIHLSTNRYLTCAYKNMVQFNNKFTQHGSGKLGDICYLEHLLVG